MHLFHQTGRAVSGDRQQVTLGHAVTIPAGFGSVRVGGTVRSYLGRAVPWHGPGLHAGWFRKARLGYVWRQGSQLGRSEGIVCGKFGLRRSRNDATPSAASRLVPISNTRRESTRCIGYGDSWNASR